MKKTRCAIGQIVMILRKVEVMINQIRTVQVSCWGVDFNERTYYRWRSKYGGMSTCGAKKLKVLEKEDERLKKMRADPSVDNAVLKEAAEGKH